MISSLFFQNDIILKAGNWGIISQGRFCKFRIGKIRRISNFAIHGKEKQSREESIRTTLVCGEIYGSGKGGKVALGCDEKTGVTGILSPFLNL